MSYKAVTINDSYVFVHPSGGQAMDGEVTVDHRNLAKGISMAQKQGRKLITFGEFFINKKLAPDPMKNFLWDGTLGGITDITGSIEAMVDPRVPSDNGEANIYINKIWKLKDIHFKGGSIGIRPGPTYGYGSGSTFENITGEDLDWVGVLEFNLNANVISTAAINCTNGWKFTYGERWGGSPSNSQSNNVRNYKPRYYFDQAVMNAIRSAFPDLKEQLMEVQTGRRSADYGYNLINEVRLYGHNLISSQRLMLGDHIGSDYVGCSGGVEDEPIIEGWSVNVGVNVDGRNSTVVKDHKIINGYHFEVVNGANDSAYKARLLGGKVSIDGYFGQYPAIVADVGATGGYIHADISNMQWARPVNGKLFKNAGSTWTGSYNSYDGGAITNANFASLVEGTPVQECGGVGCGTNKFKLVETPR